MALGGGNRCCRYGRGRVLALQREPVGGGGFRYMSRCQCRGSHGVVGVPVRSFLGDPTGEAARNGKGNSTFFGRFGIKVSAVPSGSMGVPPCILKL